jgi:hypothetical protein
MLKVSELLQSGARYTADKQWGNAGAEFAKALTCLYRKALLPPSESLEGTGQEIGPSAAARLHDKLQKKAKKEEQHDFTDDREELCGLLEHALGSGSGPQVAELRMLIEQTRNSHAHDVAAFRFQRFFEHHEGDAADSAEAVWTIVFYSRLHNPCGKKSGHKEKLGWSYVHFKIPTCTSTSFVLSSTRLQKLRPSTAAQMAYAWAHLAEAEATSTMNMYREHQMLLDTAETAVEIRTRYYHRSLLLKPKNPWTLAHCGEVYRNLANAVPNTIPDRSGSPENDNHDKRLSWYVIAIIYFREALALNPDYAWAHAHLGALVVNTRAFLGFGVLDRQDSQLLNEEPPALVELLNNWKDSSPDGKEGKLDSSPRDVNLAFINRAMMSLVRAQELQGFYYPWAQLYYAASLLIKSALTGNREMAHLSQLQTAQGYYLQPELVAEVSEPGQLPVSTNFEFAAIRHHMKQYVPAWTYAWVGMKWLFKFRFLPGLDGLIGCRLLVKIAEDHIHHLHSRQAQGGVHKEEPTDLIEAAMLAPKAKSPEPPDSTSFDIPTKPFENYDELQDFIWRSFLRFGSSSVETFLEKGVVLESNARVSLLAVLRTLMYFLQVLDRITKSQDGSTTGADTPTGRAIARRSAQIERHAAKITKKLLQHTDDNAGEKTEEEKKTRRASRAEECVKHMMKKKVTYGLFSLIEADSPSYYMIKALSEP